MRYVQLLFILLLVSSYTQAEDVNVETLMDDLEYIEYHDPGWMIIKDKNGKEIEASFYYEFITYEQIDSWKKGEAISVVYKPNFGLGLVREKDGRFYKVAFKNEFDPIDYAEAKCIDNAATTIDMVHCYSLSIDYWQDEYEYYYSYLLSSSSSSLKISIEALDKAFNNSLNKYFEAYSIYSQDSGGTIRRITTASIRVDLMKSHAVLLLEFFE